MSMMKLFASEQFVHTEADEQVKQPKIEQATGIDEASK